ncbi:MAG: GntR family transcriptional regulator [Anaerovoracaceae bacterium]|jgi:DNA-binding GntR family transcriptional regulator
MRNRTNVPELDSIIDPERIRTIHEKNPFKKVSDIVYEMLEEAILVSALEAGTKLNASRIADRLQISSTPVVSAIQQLVTDGFLVEKGGENGRYKSYHVFDITNSELVDLFSARRAIECEAAEACAIRHSLIDTDSLEKLAEDFQQGIRKYADNLGRADALLRPDLDIEFHALIAQQSDNKYLLKMYEAFSPMLRYASVRTCEFAAPETDPDIFVVLSSQHNAIIEAIKSGVPAAARSAMQIHIKYSMQVALINRRNNK